MELKLDLRQLFPAVRSRPILFYDAALVWFGAITQLASNLSSAAVALYADCQLL
jgi:hypothetical protein